jgi:hypothetical protein
MLRVKAGMAGRHLHRLPDAGRRPLDWPNATLVSGDAVDVVDVDARLKEESEVPCARTAALAMNRALMAAGLVDRVQLAIFPAGPGGTALHLVGAHVGGSVHLDRGFTAQGLVTLAAATVGGDVCGIGGQFAHTLDATGTNIAGTSRRDGFRCDGPVVRRGATAGTLHDDSESWPEAGPEPVAAAPAHAQRPRLRAAGDRLPGVG